MTNDFYGALIQHYDAVFPATAIEMAGIKELIRTRKTVLDMACGTGNKTEHLSSVENTVYAFDSDSRMIAKALAGHPGHGIRYAVADMQSLDRVFPGVCFDAVACLGNSLVHIPSIQDMEAVVRKIAAVLEEDGILVLQVLNYDRILDRNIQVLPVLETDTVRFERSYAWQNGSMHFMGTILVKDTGQCLENDVVLYPLRLAQLQALLLEAGFCRCEYYGGFHGQPHTPDSFVTIAVAYRR